VTGLPAETVDAANRAFWEEPAGTNLARSLGITELTPASFAAFDMTYLGYYPYLAPMLDRLSGRVLEIGLGSGTVASYLERRVEYFGLDIAAAPVSLARKRMIVAGHDPTLIQQGSALDLPFPDGAFDGVVSIGTLHHTGDLVRGIAEVRRVLRPGGMALVMLYNAWSFRRLIHPRDRPERQRGRYDHDAEGRVAPHTDFTSPPAARRLFATFGEVRVEVRNFDAYHYRWAPRRWFLGNIDRLLGLDLYVAAVK
jgi:SAM-dependent methyltransferase